MKFLTIEYIRTHSRLDFDCEDGELEMLGESAEQAVLNVLRRSVVGLVLKYGDVPAPIRHAALMVTDTFYEHRGSAAGQTMSAVPYGNIDFLLKPYLRLDGDDDDGQLPDGVLVTTDGRLLVDRKGQLLTINTSDMEIKGTVELPYSADELTRLLRKAATLPTAEQLGAAIEAKQDKLEFVTEEDIERDFGKDSN